MLLQASKFFALAAMLFVSYSLTVSAGLEIREFSDPAQEQRYHKLIDELRCLVCQNQNLADSNSQLAQDLRDKVYEMVIANKSDTQILEYMVNRYGEYVLYNPPLDPVTAALWIGPFVILLVAIAWLLLYINRSNRTRPASLSEEERKKSKRLLDDEKHDDEDNER